MPKNKIFYPVSTTVSGEPELGYGLLARTDDGEEKLYASISCDREAVRVLSEKINSGNISFCQLDDIIEDLLE